MPTSSSLIVIFFVIMLALVAFNGIAYQRSAHKAKRSEGISLIQWPMPMIYSGLILLFMVSALTEVMPMTNIILIGFGGIALMGFGFFRLANPHGLLTELDEKKKKNEEM